MGNFTRISFGVPACRRGKKALKTSHQTRKSGEKNAKKCKKFAEIRKNFKKFAKIARNWCVLDSD
jgi:hypothetical protein